MPRTPTEQWGALFNFAGAGKIHLELFPEDETMRCCEPVTNGDPDDTELVFADGDIVMVELP